MLRFYPHDRQEFSQLHDILKGYAAICYSKEPKRMQKVFLESLVQLLIGEVRACKEWKKREKLMFLVYDFNGRDIAEKKVALNKLKVSVRLSRKSSAAATCCTSNGWQSSSRMRLKPGQTWATGSLRTISTTHTSTSAPPRRSSGPPPSRSSTRSPGRSRSS